MGVNSIPEPGPTVSVPMQPSGPPEFPTSSLSSPTGAAEWNGPPPVPGIDGAGMQPVARLTTKPSQGPSPIVFWCIIGALGVYALFMTVLFIVAKVQSNRIPHPLEYIPDQGNPKSSKQSVVYERPAPWLDLPPNLRTELGKAIQVGDLEVEPTKIEQKPVIWMYRVSQHNPVAADTDSLVLHLRLKNISKDTVFRPTDSFFDREWKEDKDPGRNNLPYTHLVGNGHYFCGPFVWKPSQSMVQRGDNLRDEYVQGQESDKQVLKPGDEATTVIVTAPDDRVPDLLRNFTGPMQWRVQLRRGLVHYKDRDISCSAVIGIDFTMSQVEKK
jgi:hypothetical protein